MRVEGKRWLFETAYLFIMSQHVGSEDRVLSAHHVVQGTEHRLSGVETISPAGMSFCV